MISQPEVFIRNDVNIRRLFYITTGTAVLQHAFNNTICTLPVMAYLLQVLFYVSRYSDGLLGIPLAQFMLHLVNELHAHFRKIISKIERVLYLVGNACC